ncbi:hypothetical protein D3C86_680030 [compost metagenome]
MYRMSTLTLRSVLLKWSVLVNKRKPKKGSYPLMQGSKSLFGYISCTGQKYARIMLPINIQLFKLTIIIGSLSSRC